MFRIALFSLLSDASVSKQARWSLELLQNIPPNVSVDVFVDDNELRALRAENFRTPPIEQGGQFRILHYLRAHPTDYDIAVHNFENSSRSAFVRRAAALFPGIKCFHDLTLPSLNLAPFAHSTGGSDIDNYLREVLGENAPALGQYLVRGWDIGLMLRFQNFISAELHFPGIAAVFSVRHQKLLQREYGKNSLVFPSTFGPSKSSITHSTSERLRILFNLKEPDAGDLSRMFEVAASLPLAEQNVICCFGVGSSLLLEQAEKLLKNLSSDIIARFEVKYVTTATSWRHLHAHSDIIIFPNGDQRLGLPAEVFCSESHPVILVLPESYIGEEAVDLSVVRYQSLGFRPGVGQWLHLRKILLQVITDTGLRGKLLARACDGINSAHSANEFIQFLKSCAFELAEQSKEHYEAQLLKRNDLLENKLRISFPVRHARAVLEHALSRGAAQLWTNKQRSLTPHYE